MKFDLQFSRDSLPNLMSIISDAKTLTQKEEPLACKECTIAELSSDGECIGRRMEVGE